MISMTDVRLDEGSMIAVEQVLKSGQLAQGTVVAAFEDAFSRYVGTKYAIAVNSGTAALHVALAAAGISQGDEVITTSFSFIATANACLFCNAVPVFADIDYQTFNISPESIERKITSKTKAVIIVDLYGQPCDMDEIVSICRKHDLVLIEDACQAHGAEYKGQKVGSFGIGCFSFYPTKNMTTSEGGMITTNDESIAERSRMIRQHGQSQRYVHDILGYNYRMTDIEAAIGINQLKVLDIANEKRTRNAASLTDYISQIPGLIPPYIAPDRNHVFHQFTIKVTQDYKLSRSELQKSLSAKNIGSNIYYPIPIHKQTLYKNLGYHDELPITDKLTKEALSLPVHPGLTGEEINIIAEALRNA